jgi:hypothetical protein
MNGYFTIGVKRLSVVAMFIFLTTATKAVCSEDMTLNYVPVRREIVVAPRHAALRLASFEASAGLFLLVRGQRRLAAEFDALLLGVGPAPRGAFEDAAAFELRRHAKDGEDDLGEVGSGIEERLGE